MQKATRFSIEVDSPSTYHRIAIAIDPMSIMQGADNNQKTKEVKVPAHSVTLYSFRKALNTSHKKKALIDLYNLGSYTLIYKSTGTDMV